jgi:two-component system sensor histidine kinase UhpB
LPRRAPPADPPEGDPRDAPTQADLVAAGTSGGEPLELSARVREITRQNERIFHELIAGERRFRGLARSVWNVQEAERRRLARELHDGIGQTLTALKQQLDVVEQSAASLPDATRTRLRDAVELAAQALHETRELSRLLRPQVLDDLGLEPALRWLTRTFSERHGVALEVDLVGLDRRLSSPIETLAYRVVQEALNNVAKHAGAQRAQVLARCEGGELTLVVADDGRGFDSSSRPEATDGAGSGLRGLRDRVELFGGRVEIGSRPGLGTRIVARVPCAEAEAAAAT